jgi:hypothetical protein
MLQYSPKITTDGLVMCLDPSQNKSYPTTDLPVKGGLVMWMDAADDSTFSYSSGTTVSQWRDKSGFNYHMTPTSAGPTRNSSLNSRKTLLITSAQQIGNLSINLQTSANTVFVVSRLTGGANGRVLTAYYNNWLLGHWGGQTDKYYAEGWVYDTYNAADTAWRIHTGDWSGSSTDLANFYSSGTTLATNSSAASQGPSGLGINSQGYELSNAEAAEIIVFNRILTTAERRLVHTYLGQKWGILNTDRSIIDLSGFNDNGLLGNGTTADMPAFDFYNKGALRLDGSTDYITVPDSTALSPSTVTVSLWLKRNNYQSGITNFIRRNDFDSYALMATYNTDTVWFRIRNSVPAVVDAQTSMSLNTWTNLVGTFDGSNVRIYKDGALANTASNTSPISYSASNPTMIIGRDDAVSGRYAPVSYGSILIYGRALSASEIAQNYEAQKSRFANTIIQQGLVLNIDAANPYSYGGAGTTVYDTSNTALSWTATNVTYNSDPIKYFSFNGSNSSLVSSTSTAYDSQTITMECWCYPNSLNQLGFLFEKGAVNSQYSMFFENANFQFRTMGLSNQDVTITSTSFMTVNAWNHIVCTYTSGNKITYINGVQAGGLSGITGTLNTGGTNQYIGKYGNAGDNYPFNGRIAESRVYNIALTAAQVLQNYNATRTKYGL